VVRHHPLEHGPGRSRRAVAPGRRGAGATVRRYWPPVQAFIRRRGHAPADAQDLAQEFSARLLKKNYLQAADAVKGKFRTLLLTAVTCFLINERERAMAQKRGGGAVHFPLEADHAEEGYRVGPADPATPETIYERRWAEMVLETVLVRLRRELAAAGQQERFEVLKPFLAAERQAPSGAKVAAWLGLSVPEPLKNRLTSTT